MCYIEEMCVLLISEKGLALLYHRWIQSFCKFYDPQESRPNWLGVNVVLWVFFGDILVRHLILKALVIMCNFWSLKVVILLSLISINLLLVPKIVSKSYRVECCTLIRQSLLAILVHLFRPWWGRSANSEKIIIAFRRRSRSMMKNFMRFLRSSLTLSDCHSTTGDEGCAFMYGVLGEYRMRLGVSNVAFSLEQSVRWSFKLWH